MSLDMDMSEFHGIFFEETSEHLASLETLLVGLDREQPDPEAMNAIFRAAHSIKGSAGTFGFPDMAAVTHDLETLLDKARKGELVLTEEIVDITLEARDVLLAQLDHHQGAAAVAQSVVDSLCARVRALASGTTSAVAEAAAAVEVVEVEKPKAAVKVIESSSIRVSVEKVDQLINLVGELVITQSMLALTEQSPLNDGSADAERLLERLQQLERNTRELQETVMSIRMLPVSAVFNRFPRLVRDLAGKLDKQIELRTFGESTELDRGVIEKITDPLTHLIRNSVDHGINRQGDITSLLIARQSFLNSLYYV